MKTALVVGGDNVSGVKQTLHSYGIERVDHWSGRKSGDAKHIIPRDTQIVVIMTGWINHALTYKIKRSAQKLGLKVLYANGNGGNLHVPLNAMASA